MAALPPVRLGFTARSEQRGLRAAQSLRDGFQAGQCDVEKGLLDTSDIFLVEMAGLGELSLRIAQTLAPAANLIGQAATDGDTGLSSRIGFVPACRTGREPRHSEWHPSTTDWHMGRQYLSPQGFPLGPAPFGPRTTWGLYVSGSSQDSGDYTYLPRARCWGGSLGPQVSCADLTPSPFDF